MTELWQALRDPKVSISLVLGVIVMMGFGLVWQGWRGAAATLFVRAQVPYLVSGAFIGIALIGSGLALLNTHLDRTEAAQERREVTDIQRGVLKLLAHAPEARARLQARRDR